MIQLGLTDQVILVTGGNRGIGTAIVSLLVQLGAQVAYTYRSDPGDQANALAIPADVTDLEAMAEAAATAEQKLGAIYGVVANAGITRDNFFPKLTSADWDAVINCDGYGVAN